MDKTVAIKGYFIAIWTCSFRLKFLFMFLVVTEVITFTSRYTVQTARCVNIFLRVIIMTDLLGLQINSQLEFAAWIMELADFLFGPRLFSRSEDSVRK